MEILNELIESSLFMLKWSFISCE